ncbi:hypothetical protein P4a_00059 [Klebsiella phage VLCpiP4a]|nr:hypothetical protein P4a_00059 [Klebsiella phage VLCpiP4a]
MTLLKNLTAYDLNKMELFWSARGHGKSTLVAIFDSLDEISNINTRSPLEVKLDDLINTYWSSEGSKAYHAILAAQKANPRTKDIFRSKSTPHTFPWYHRKRKY